MREKNKQKWKNKEEKVKESESMTKWHDRRQGEERKKYQKDIKEKKTS